MLEPVTLNGFLNQLSDEFAVFTVSCHRQPEDSNGRRLSSVRLKAGTRSATRVGFENPAELVERAVRALLVELKLDDVVPGNSTFGVCTPCGSSEPAVDLPEPEETDYVREELEDKLLSFQGSVLDLTDKLRAIEELVSAYRSGHCN